MDWELGSKLSRFNPLVSSSQLNIQEMPPTQSFLSIIPDICLSLRTCSIPAMESLLQHSSAKVVAPRLPKLKAGSGLFANQNTFFKLPQENSYLGRRKLLIVEAKKNKNNDSKQDTHSFIPKPDETTGFFPEAVLLKEVSFYSFSAHSLCSCNFVISMGVTFLTLVNIEFLA